MKRREFLTAVGYGVAVAVLPAVSFAGPGNMTATEVAARSTLFQEQFMAEFLQQYKQLDALNNLMCYGRSVVKVLDTPDVPWFTLKSVPQ